MSQILWTVPPTPLSAWGKTPFGGGRAETGQKPSALRRDRSLLLGRIWESSWGLRIALGFVVVLVWTGAASLSSSSAPATGPAISPSVSSPIVVPAPAPPDPTAGVSTPVTANLPRQSLDITYDYGPGPQPVPGPSAATTP